MSTHALRCCPHSGLVEKIHENRPLQKTPELDLIMKRTKPMETRISNLALLSALIAGLVIMLCGPVMAQTFTTIYNFVGAGDGAWPQSGLILSGNTLYGAANIGGTSGDGTVFALNIDGSAFTTLHSFSGGGNGGVYPHVGILVSNTLYGSAVIGGSSGNGTVFAFNIDGSGFTNVHSFKASGTNHSGIYTNSDGNQPIAGLILSGNTLFGTTTAGGTNGSGTVFAVNIDGSGFTNVHSFKASCTNSSGIYTNSDGASPWGGLVLSGNTLYGTTARGGTSGSGALFTVNTDGTGFRNVYSFSATSGPRDAYGYGTNSDGVWPWAGLILSANTLYGTTYLGGNSGAGTVFAVSSDGTGFAVLHSFTGLSAPTYAFATNGDGAYPSAGLILLGNTLYGTASGGGSSGNGTVFAVNIDGSGFTVLHSFTPGVGSEKGDVFNSDGANPIAGLTLSGITLYGTAQAGGSFGNGTVFSLSFPPQLTIIPSGANMVLTWPTNYRSFDYTGYTLQSSTNLTSLTAWKPASPSPVVIGGQNVVVNPISGTQEFYRLKR